ncbi:MAG: diacylglycerol kinase family protein [Polyangiales bacterium]
MRAGAEVVVACGGDGTVSAVAGALVDTPAALGIIPRGTANSVAAAPRRAERPRECVRGDRVGPRRLAAARVAGRTMVLMATIGLHARAVTEAAGDKAALGVLAYVTKGVEVAASGESFTATVRADEVGAVTLRLSSLTVANLAPPHSLLAQGPDALRPDDGKVDVTMVSFEGLIEAAVTAAHLLRSALVGEPATRENVAWFRAARVTVEADPPQALMVDGEAVGETPFTVEARPRSLRVLVPSGEG